VCKILQDDHRTFDQVRFDDCSLFRFLVYHRSSSINQSQQCFTLFDAIHSYTDDLDVISRLYITDDSIRSGLTSTTIRITEEVLEDYFLHDGCQYLELRTTPRATKNATERDYVEVVLNRIAHFLDEQQPKHPHIVGAFLLLSINRAESLEKAWSTIQLAAELKEKGSHIKIHLTFQSLEASSIIYHLLAKDALTLRCEWN